MFQEQSVSRREMLSGGAKLVAGGALAMVLAERFGVVAAQDATPVTGDSLGYPELTVTVNDDGFDLSTDTVPAGYVLLTVNNATAQETGAGVLGPGPGMTMDDLQAAAAATPTSDSQGFPSFFYQAAIPGGPGSVPAGGTGQAIIQLAAGDWVVWGEGDQPPAFFSAAEGSPTSQAAPTPDVTITEIDFGFTGFDTGIPSGQQTWAVTNTGKQPHMLVLGKVPEGTTIDQVMEAVQREEGATPPAGGLTEEDFQDQIGVLLQSTGTTVWPLINLEEGHYVALCFVPDPDNGGIPHAMEGMVAIFDTGGAGASSTPTG